MNIEEVRNYMLSKPYVTEATPFDDVSPVYKVGGKIFAILSLNTDHSINLKCPPERAIELREHHSYIIPGYHMNKQNWNTIYIKQCSDNLLVELIDLSYHLIYENLPKKIKNSLI